MKCEECRELLFDYYDNEVGDGIENQIEAHFKVCPSCRREFEEVSLRLNLFKINMPVIQVENNFTEQVMQSINLAQATAFFKRIVLGFGIVSALLTLGLAISMAPIVISLLTLFGSILVGIISTFSAIWELFPIVQISSSIILIMMLLGVTASIRHIVLHDSFK